MTCAPNALQSGDGLVVLEPGPATAPVGHHARLSAVPGCSLRAFTPARAPVESPSYKSTQLRRRAAMEAGKDRTSALSHARGADSGAAARGDDRSKPRPHDRALRRARGARLVHAGSAASRTRSWAPRSTSSRAGLLAAGIERGDRVGIWSPNCAEWVLVQYATAKIGVILVNINPAYRTSELEYALRQSGCRMLISAPAFKTSDYRAMVERCARACPSSSRSCSWTQRTGSSCWPGRASRDRPGARGA